MKKALFLIVLTFLFVSTVAASPTDEAPHRVFGEITDEDESPVAVELMFEHGGEEVVSFETDTDGVYDVYVPYDSAYEDDTLVLIADGQELGEITFERLEVSELDATYETESDEGSDSGPSTPPSQGPGHVEPPAQSEDVSISVQPGEQTIIETPGAVERINVTTEETPTLTEITLDVDTDENEGDIRVDESPEAPEAVEPLDSAIGYQQISFSIPDDDISGADIDFRVAQEDVNLPRDYWDAALHKYDEQWTELETEYVGEEDGHYLFRGHTDSFSVFASAIEYDYSLDIDDPTIPDSVEPGESFTVQTSADSPTDGEPIFYWNGNEGDSEHKMTFEEPGEHEVQLTVSDGTVEETYSYTVHVEETEDETEPQTTFTGQLISSTSTPATVLFVLLGMLIGGGLVWYRKRD